MKAVASLTLGCCLCLSAGAGLGALLDLFGPKPVACRLGCNAPRCLCLLKGHCDCEPDADCRSCGACLPR